MTNKLAAALLALTAGCASESSDGAFHLHGRVDAPAGVTHVIATNPDTGERVIVRPDGSGAFDLALEPRQRWIVVFADWTKVGKDMQVATLQAGGLDAFAPQSPGSVDFGTVEIRGARAHGSVEWRDLLLALDIDDETATRMARTDNLALRYANPDIDNDGTIDGLQYGHDFRLDVTGAYTLLAGGRDVTIADLVRGYDAPGVRYESTTLQVALPRAMGMEMATGTVMFEAPFYGSALGPYTPTVAPYTEIGAPHVKTGSLDGVSMLGVVARGEHDAPSGTYELGFANGHLTFSDVYVPSASSLGAPKDHAVPFLRIRPVVEGCVSDCDIRSVDLAWRRVTEGGWAAAEPQPASLEVFARMNGESTYLRADVTSSVAWSDMPVWNTGITRSELAYISTAELCYVKVSYETELGMKMTTAVANPACR